MIHIYCDGGLGNRLLSLFSGLYYVKQTERPFIIHWPSNNWCGCNFSDIFDNNYNTTNFNLKFINEQVLTTCTLLVHELQVPFKPNKIILNGSLSKEQLIYLFITEENVLYSGNSLHNTLIPDDISDVIKTLIINKNIQNKISLYDVSDAFGLHIRGTDFPEPPDLTIDQIHQVVNDHPLNKYFLCSDQKDIELDFKQKHKNIMVFEKNYYVEKLDKNQGWIGRIVDGIDRVSSFNVNRGKESTIEAFCDMLLLSKTKLIKTSSSSFLKCSHVLSKGL